MHVAVLGGGLQGCCIALALAERGIDVTLFDRNERLLSRAAVANEGKIHLGYMYAGDPTLSTARMMMQGALAFARFFSRHLGSPIDALATSQPAVYLVHRDSQRPPAEVGRYLAAVHELVREAAQAEPDSYFGIDLRPAPAEWKPAALEREFNPAAVMAAFDTPEVAIDPVALAALVGDCVTGNPRIDLRLRETVLAVEQDSGRLRVIGQNGTGKTNSRYDHVVNALWDGRLAVNETLGHRPGRPWLHRLKYGVSFKQRTAKAPRSATIVLGPFGEVVSYADGLTYLTWYPHCLRGMSREVAPPEWGTYPDEPLRSQVLEGTLAALSDIVLPLRDLSLNDLQEPCVKGGVIVAWGETDIDDPASELHRRFEIGVTSVGRFHSVDPGKLTMAPYFADLCARRIAEFAG